MNLAFYTCFYGDDSNVGFIIPKTPSLKYNCYYYTNNTNMFNDLKNTNWIGIYDNKPVTNDDLISARISKHIKVMPQTYTELKKYDYLCYLDSKISVDETIVEKQIEDYFINQNYALVLKRHGWIKDNVWNEYNEAMYQFRYRLESEKYINYIINQIRNGLSDKTNEHCLTGYLVRNMKHPKTIEMNTLWFDHIQDCGIECQISFFFVKQLFSEYILSFSENPKV